MHVFKIINLDVLTSNRIVQNLKDLLNRKPSKLFLGSTKELDACFFCLVINPVSNVCVCFLFFFLGKQGNAIYIKNWGVKTFAQYD